MVKEIEIKNEAQVEKINWLACSADRKSVV